jgi:hypothetical protein
MPARPESSSASEKAPVKAARDHPSSSCIGVRKTVKA